MGRLPALIRSARRKPEHLPVHMADGQKKGKPRPDGHWDDPPSLRQVEYEAILDALRSTDGNMTQAARLLGIGRNTLYRRLRKLGGK